VSPAASAQLAFAAEFATFLVAVAGLASALRPGLLSLVPWARSALASGFLGLATASFLRGALVIAEPDTPVLQAMRAASILALLAGLVRWRGDRSRFALGLGLVAYAAAGLARWSDRVELGDGLRWAGASAVAVALVSVARRSISARIAVDAALLVLGVVLVVALSVSVTVSDSVEGEALRRYTSRAMAEADAAVAEARAGLGPARLVAGVLAAERGEALARSAAVAEPSAADVADLEAALADLTADRLLDLADPVVLMSVTGAPVAASPVDLPSSTRVSLAGDAVVREALAAGAERQGVVVIGADAFAVAAAPIVVRPEGSPQEVVGAVVVARRLDDTYLRVLGRGGEDLSFALATPSRVVARTGAGLARVGVVEVAEQVVRDGARPGRRDDRGFVAAAPVDGGDGRPVLALVVVAPAAAAEDAQEALFRTLFVVALAAALAAVAIGVVVGERIGLGLVRLTDAARRLQAGALDTRVEVRSDDELGVLGGAFSSMARSIGVMTDELRAVAADEAAVRARLEAVVAGMSEALLAVDGEGRVIEVNRAAEDLLARRRADVLGRPVAEVVSWRLLDGSAAPLDRADLLDGEAMAADLAVGADTVPVVITAGTLHRGPGDGPGGADGGAVLVLRDVRREREVDDLKSSILANIGHELRTPLTPIKGYAGMLRDRRLDETRTRAFAGEILTGVDQLERVVRQLVTFATIAAGRLAVVPVPTRVADLADGVRTRWSARLDGHHHLTVEVADHLDLVWVDRSLLDQAVDELVDNAVKYSPDGGPVEVRFTPAAAGEHLGDGAHADADGAIGAALTITVTDRGVGIPPNRLDDLTEAFTQADASATRRFNGLGLGLACADRIVRAHGGRLAYTSGEQRGTTVSILVPLAARAGEPV
jgi:signal transduction histidine kinase/HAMP domain-containing protein